MANLFSASIALVNLPFTVLLVLIIFYWVGVILGAVDIELFDIDLSPDMESDLEIGQTGGFLYSFFHLLNIGDVPVMVVFSVAILCAWCFSMLSNYYLNNGMSLLIGAALLVPNLLVSLLAAAMVTRPLKKIFATFDTNDSHQKIVGRVGTVVSGAVNTDYGQIEIQTAGAPLRVNVRTTGDMVLKKGDAAIVYDEDSDNNIYLVEKFEA